MQDREPEDDLGWSPSDRRKRRKYLDCQLYQDGRPIDELGDELEDEDGEDDVEDEKSPDPSDPENWDDTL